MDRQVRQLLRVFVLVATGIALLPIILAGEVSAPGMNPDPAAMVTGPGLPSDGTQPASPARPLDNASTLEKLRFLFSE